MSPTPPSPPGGGLFARRLTVKAAAAIVIGAVIVGAGLALVLSGDDSESDRAVDAAADREDVVDEDQASAGTPDEADDEPALGLAEANCPGTLVEGDGAEFTTERGPLRICGAEFPRAFLPGFETPVPPGLDLEILAIWMEPADGQEANAYSDLFQGDAVEKPTVTVPSGEEGVLEMGGLLSGQLVVAYTVPSGTGPTFTFRYGDNDPITLTVG